MTPNWVRSTSLLAALVGCASTIESREGGPVDTPAVVDVASDEAALDPFDAPDAALDAPAFDIADARDASTDEGGVVVLDRPEEDMGDASRDADVGDAGDARDADDEWPCIQDPPERPSGRHQPELRPRSRVALTCSPAPRLAIARITGWALSRPIGYAWRAEVVPIPTPNDR